MASAPLPANEHQRTDALHRYELLDSLPERAYDDLIAIAAGICGTPMAAVSLIDAERQWFKARIGLPVCETPRSASFCAHAILTPEELFVVEDAANDQRFVDNPLVTGDPGIRFYAGAPLLTSDGFALGSLCVIDSTPRVISPFQRSALFSLSRQVGALMELRLAYRDLRHHLAEREWFEEQLQQRNAELSEQSRTDTLTGLPNRRAFDASLDVAMADSRALGAPLLLALVDIDHFKKVNDVHGHPAGDLCLARVATVLNASRGPGVFVARCGGEEFAVLLTRADLQTAVAICEQARRDVAAIDAQPVVTVSIGLAEFREGDNVASLVARADQALYRAKDNGRNCIVIDR